MSALSGKLSYSSPFLWIFKSPIFYLSLIAQLVKNPPAMQKTLVQFLGQEDPLEKVYATHSIILELPLWLSWWRIHLQCDRPAFDPWIGKISWRREGLPTPVFWPGEFHGQSPWGRKESDMTESLSLFLFKIKSMKCKYIPTSLVPSIYPCPCLPLFPIRI